MSAPRLLLARLWAAVWLRWRLTRVKLVRLFGGRHAAVAGPDYHLTPVETPVEGLDYDDPAELPDDLIATLELTRVELLKRQPRRVRPATSRRAHRRRVASLATAAILAVGAVGTGVAALVTGSTGVPAVDRLLGIYEADVVDPGATGRSGGTTRDLQPGSSGSSTSVELVVGSRRLTSTSYVGRDGRVCSVLTDGKGATGDVVCMNRVVLAARVARDGGMVLGIEDQGDIIVLRGLVTDQLTALSGRGPSGPLDVEIGEPWSDVGGADAVRPFVATGRSDGRGLINPSDYVFRVIDDGGRSREIRP